MIGRQCSLGFLVHEGNTNMLCFECCLTEQQGRQVLERWPWVRIEAMYESDALGYDMTLLGRAVTGLISGFELLPSRLQTHIRPEPRLVAGGRGGSPKL